MSNSNTKSLNIKVRHKRIRAKVSGTLLMPRLSVFRSNKNVYAQIINDDKGITIVGLSSEKVKGKGSMERAGNVGKEIAKLAMEKGIKKVVFDRGGFLYTGKIKAVADGAREGGLKF
ncbi:MAG: 50S ribosomal protein L18 [Candidatus Paceibacterota bacterium]|jgi:large subunit ribosomal protein L18